MVPEEVSYLQVVVVWVPVAELAGVELVAVVVPALGNPPPPKPWPLLAVSAPLKHRFVPSSFVARALLVVHD